MHKALNGATITCYLCGKVYANSPDKVPPFSVVGDRAVCDDHLDRAKLRLEHWSDAYARLGRMVTLKKQLHPRRLSALELEFLDILLADDIPAWIASHLNDPATVAVDKLIARGLAMRLACGDIAVIP